MCEGFLGNDCHEILNISCIVERGKNQSAQSFIRRHDLFSPFFELLHPHFSTWHIEYLLHETSMIDEPTTIRQEVSPLPVHFDIMANFID